MIGEKDFLTNQQGLAFATSEFEHMKSIAGAGCVLVKIKLTEDMPLKDIEEKVRRMGQVLVNITGMAVARIYGSDFMIFTNECEMWKNRIDSYLREISDCGYTIKITLINESDKIFPMFMERLYSGRGYMRM